MKKQAILIQCHNKPEQINRLINFFPDNLFDIYIHVDKKSNIEKDIIQKHNVYLVQKRVDVRWGRYSQVEATIELINIMKNPREYSYCHLVSGNDFPIKPVEWFIDKFSESNENEYIEANLLDGTSTWSWGGLDRIYCYYPKWMIQRPTNKPIKIVRVVYREIVMRSGLLKKKNLTITEFYGGSSWWSVTGKMLEWMNQYIKTNPEFNVNFAHGICVDELFFSTLANISPYRENITNNHMRFMKWYEAGKKTGGPANLEINDINTMLKTSYAFGRKFVDIETINMVVKKLHQYEKR